MHRHGLIARAATLAVGVAIGASAIALAEPAPQTYTGCLTKDGLLTRVAIGDAPARACAKTETQISWSAQGPQGLQGPQGEQGPQGVPPTVAAEPPGVNCLYGGYAVTDAVGTIVYACSGAPGATGATGEKGDPGEPGAPGAPGVPPAVATLPPGDEHCPAGGISVTDAASQVTYVCTAAKGDTGEQGLQGPPGVDGAAGEDGFSPTVAPEPAGTNCQYGGAAITDADGPTLYVCNGAPAATPSKTVFVTSAESDGALGGVGGADSICTLTANDHGLSGFYRAWISARPQAGDPIPWSPSRMFTKSDGAYVLRDGVKVADNWTDLTDGTLDHAINVDEHGTTMPDDGYTWVWTGTNPDGTLNTDAGSAGDCNYWTGGEYTGSIGGFYQTDALWTKIGSALRCQLAQQSHLYCFEQ